MVSSEFLKELKRITEVLNEMSDDEFNKRFGTVLSVGGSSRCPQCGLHGKSRKCPSCGVDACDNCIAVDDADCVSCGLNGDIFNDLKDILKAAKE